MTLVAHLTELRNRILKALLALLVAVALVALMLWAAGGLAFVAGLQRLPPRQAATLVLRATPPPRRVRRHGPRRGRSRGG